MKFSEHLNFITFSTFKRRSKMFVWLCGKECHLLRRGGQTNQLETVLTELPNVKNEQLLFVIDFEPCQRCSDWRKLL